MQLKLDKRFWVVITCIIVVFTIFIVGRNLLHAIETVSYTHLTLPTN